MRITFITLVLVLFVASRPIMRVGTANTDTLRQDDAILIAIKELRSNRPSIRSAAKTRLVQAGNDAVGPVMSLLSELLERATNRLPVQEESAPPLRSGSQDGSEHLSTWTTIDDCCDVLGGLRARQAVGLLIRVVEVRGTYAILPPPKRPSELNAIALIGKAAEGALIEELKTAQQRAVSLVSEMRAEGDNQRQWLEERKVYEIQVQMTEALSRVGDSGTIEALEALLKSNVEYGRSWRAIVEGAIAKISSRSGHVPR